MSNPINSSLQYINVGYILSSPDRSIRLSNSAAQKLLGVKKTLSSLADVAELLPKDLNLMDHVRYCGIEHRSCSFQRVEINDLTIKLFLSPVFEDKQLVGSLLTLEDVTAKVMQEKAHDQFLSLLVHDLRTPLTAVQGNSSLLQDLYSDPRTEKRFQKIVGYISTGSQNVLDMVNQFMDMARLEDDRIKFDLQEFDLVALSRETVDELRVLVKDKGLKLAVNTLGHESLQVVGDPMRTKQVISNLVGNALKFTEKGTIEVSIRKDKSVAEVAVKDTGMGIPKENQDQLFQKFFQASNNIMKIDSSKSTGLGLYVTRLMVEGMGGTIGLVESRVGEGSTFAFALDLATPERLEHLKTQINEMKENVKHAKVDEHVSTALLGEEN